MILLVIGGTPTPVFLLGAPGATGVVGLITMCMLIPVALLIHLFWMDAPEKLVGSPFISMRSRPQQSPQGWPHAGIAPAILLIAGSLLHDRLPPPTKPETCPSTCHVDRRAHRSVPTSPT